MLHLIALSFKSHSRFPPNSGMVWETSGAVGKGWSQLDEGVVMRTLCSKKNVVMMVGGSNSKIGSGVVNGLG